VSGQLLLNYITCHLNIWHAGSPSHDLGQVWCQGCTSQLKQGHRKKSVGQFGNVTSNEGFLVKFVICCLFMLHCIVLELKARYNLTELTSSSHLGSLSWAVVSLPHCCSYMHICTGIFGAC